MRWWCFNPNLESTPKHQNSETAKRSAAGMPGNGRNTLWLLSINPFVLRVVVVPVAMPCSLPSKANWSKVTENLSSIKMLPQYPISDIRYPIKNEFLNAERLKHGVDAADWNKKLFKDFKTGTNGQCPLLLSVWLSIAHWCVMDTDSFSKELVSGLHNEWEHCVRPETEQQKSPITIQLEHRLELTQVIFNVVLCLRIKSGIRTSSFFLIYNLRHKMIDNLPLIGCCCKHKFMYGINALGFQHNNWYYQSRVRGWSSLVWCADFKSVGV